MGLIKGPKGIDFIIQSRPLTPQEEAELSVFIQRCKDEMKRKKAGRKPGSAKKKKPKQPALVATH